MNIEEKSVPDAIRLAGDRLFHVHSCENDRGTPGTGHVPWPEVFQALHDIGYGGQLVTESFTPAVQEIAKAVSMWRPLDATASMMRRKTQTPTLDLGEPHRIVDSTVQRVMHSLDILVEKGHMSPGAKSTVATNLQSGYMSSEDLDVYRQAVGNYKRAVYEDLEISEPHLGFSTLH